MAESSKDKTVAIYGGGSGGDFLFNVIKDILSEYKITFKYFITSSENKSEKLCGYPIINIKEINKDKVGFIICAVNKKHYKNINIDLQRINYPVSDILYLYREDTELNIRVLVACVGPSSYFSSLMRHILEDTFKFKLYIRSKKLIDLYKKGAYGIIPSCHKEILEKLPIGFYFSDHIRWFPEFSNFIKKPNTKIVWNSRDIRDAIVTNIYRMFYRDKTLYEKMSLQDYVEKKYDLIEYARYEKDILFPFIGLKGVFHVKFEDLKMHGQEYLKKIFEYLELPVTNYDIVRSLYLSDFTTVYGRRQGEDVLGEMRRGGQCGEWKTFFNKKQKELLKEEIGDILIKLGYEKDYNW